MVKIKPQYLAAAAGMICIICICLTLFVDVATICTFDTEKNYSMIELLTSSDFDSYPYSKISNLWRVTPLIILAMTVVSLICSLLYKKKAVAIIGDIISYVAAIVTMFFNKMWVYDGGEKFEYAMTSGLMLYTLIMMVCGALILEAHRKYVKDISE